MADNENANPNQVVLKDKQLNCSDCHHDFEWSAGEQEYYRDRGLAQPKRCPACRIKRRQQVRGTVRIVSGDPE